MRSPYDILNVELPPPPLRHPSHNSKLLKYTLKRNMHTAHHINSYSHSHNAKHISLATQVKSVRLDHTDKSPTKLSLSARLDDFLLKIKTKREKPKGVFQLCVNNCSVALEEGPVVIKNSTNRSKSRRIIMPRITSTLEKENRNRSKACLQVLEDSVSHFRVHHVLV